MHATINGIDVPLVIFEQLDVLAQCRMASMGDPLEVADAARDFQFDELDDLVRVDVAREGGTLGWLDVLDAFGAWKKGELELVKD